MTLARSALRQLHPSARRTTLDGPKHNARPTVVAAALLAATCGPVAKAPEPANAQQATQGSLFAATPSTQWRLPPGLTEISGLAVSPNGRLFAHDDESAVIYEIDVGAQRPVRAFTLGDPPLSGDFEGLAITPAGDFWLTTSAGVLYQFREGADGEAVPWRRHDAQLAEICEVEGLAYLATDESLILACKHNKTADMRDDVILRSWRVGQAEATPWLRARQGDAAAAAGVRRFRPSAVDIDPQTGRILLLAGADRAYAEFTPQGALLNARSLRREHRQAEGLAVLPDGALAIADEGGRDAALISIYPRAGS